jgi:hypothetical protein
MKTEPIEVFTHPDGSKTITWPDGSQTIEKLEEDKPKKKQGQQS